MIREQAPASKRNSHGPEVFRTDGHQTGSRRRIEIGWPALRVNPSSHATAFQWQLIRERHVVRAGSCLELLDQSSLQRNALFHVINGRSGHAEAKRQDVIGIEAGRCAGEIPKVDNEDRTHGQQRERERDFRNDERARYSTAAPSRRGPHAFTKNVGRRRMRCLQERRQAGQRARDNGGAKCEQQNSPVQTDFFRAGKVI